MMKSENNIPKFDLAEQILAAQRKNSSRKRFQPAKVRAKNKSNNSGEKLHPYDIMYPTQSDPRPEVTASKTGNTQNVVHNTKNSEQIIAEIVARDIRQIRSECI